jgi:hypothetical protein
MSRESELKRAVQWASPKSIRRRIRTAPLLGVTLLSAFVPILALTIHLAAPQEAPTILSWNFGVVLWLFTVLSIPVYLYAAGRVTRAMTAYLLVTLALYPSALALLEGALRVSFGILGARSTNVIGVGLLAGLATLPLAIRSRRRGYQDELRSGRLQNSLSKESGRWNPQFDFADLETKRWLNRPGCLLRLLPWIGPAIGISLADMVGRSTADAIIAVGFLMVGYSMMYFGLLRAFVQFLEFRRMESELGNPIMLAEEPAGA